MSFAYDFDHYIPSDDDREGGYSRRRKNSYSSSYLGTLYKSTVRRSFIGIEHETPKAYLIEFEEGMAWVPKSRAELDMDSLILKIPYWLEKKLIFKNN